MELDDTIGRFAGSQTQEQYAPKQGFRITWAKVWCVDPTRGDLYVVSVAEGTSQFVRVSEGIVNDPNLVMNTAMRVMCDQTGQVIALPSENTDWFYPCVPEPAPPLHVFS